MDGVPAIRFIDPAVFAICQPIWDTDGDGYLTENEVSKTQRIPQGAFNGNKEITTLDDLEKLGGYVYHAGSFDSMPNLITAAFGLKINLNGAIDTFTISYANCPKLERVRLNKYIIEISNGTFQNDISLKTVIFGGNEVKIGAQSFYKCSSLEEIELPDSVTTIGNFAFRECAALKAIILSNIKSLGSTSFAGCASLKIDVHMPLLEGELNQTFSSSGITSASFGKITKVSNFALGSCPNLRYVILPETMTTIGNASFYGSTALEYIVCHATTPPTLDYSAFNGGVSCLVYVPDSSVSNYQSATNWSKIASRIKPLSEKP